MNHFDADTGEIAITQISSEFINEKKIGFSVLRLDQIHPVISGNKWFKLRYYLQDARERNCKTLVTFGGAYSNHIVATAYAAKINNFHSFGIIRGEEPAQFSPTLTDASHYGMKLKFVSRSEYGYLKKHFNQEEFQREMEYPYLVPEGGFGEKGMKGAAGILQIIQPEKYSHIVMAVGTGCTTAGILQAASDKQKIIGISVLRGIGPLAVDILRLSQKPDAENFVLNIDYHFGGYAKRTKELIEFMNALYLEHQLPTDFVYTGKLLFGAMDLIKKDYFPSGSQILAIHSGGLQGNRSLVPGTLVY